MPFKLFEIMIGSFLITLTQLEKTLASVTMKTMLRHDILIKEFPNIQNLLFRKQTVLLVLMPQSDIDLIYNVNSAQTGWAQSNDQTGI